MKHLKRHISFFAAIVFMAAIIFLNSKGYLEFFKKKFYSFFYYPESVISKISFLTMDNFSFLFGLKSHYNDKILLTEENNRLRKEISDLKELDNENRLLRSALGLPFSKEHSIADANVIGKDPYNFFNYLIINRGTEAKIAADMDVVDASGFYIGKIIEPEVNKAKVVLINDNNSVIGAIDQNTRVKGLVKNDRDVGLYFDMVSQEDKVAVDDIITTLPVGSGVSVYPIAKITLVEKYPNKTFQKIRLAPMADMKKIEKVFILLD